MPDARPRDVRSHGSRPPVTMLSSFVGTGRTILRNHVLEATARVTPLGRWWAAAPRAPWPEHPGWRDALGRHWSDAWGDRRQELVFIGTGLEEAAIRHALDARLVGGEDGPAAADRVLPDPFPAWGTA